MPPESMRPARLWGQRFIFLRTRAIPTGVPGGDQITEREINEGILTRKWETKVRIRQLQLPF